jgi:hypothetical protein
MQGLFYIKNVIKLFNLLYTTESEKQEECMGKGNIDGHFVGIMGWKNTKQNLKC